MSALLLPGRHPDLEARQDAIALATYRALRTLVATLAPAAPLPPDIAELGSGWVDDLIATRAKHLQDNKPEA